MNRPTPIRERFMQGTPIARSGLSSFLNALLMSRNSLVLFCRAPFISAVQLPGCFLLAVFQHPNNILGFVRNNKFTKLSRFAAIASASSRNPQPISDLMPLGFREKFLIILAHNPSSPHGSKHHGIFMADGYMHGQRQDAGHASRFMPGRKDTELMRRIG